MTTEPLPPSPAGAAAPAGPSAGPTGPQLTRDPTSSLGGVASGLAHHFAIDVSLVRLAFVVFTLFSGVGFVVYILAWMIVPAATQWPPAPTSRAANSVSSRELLGALLLVGTLVALGLAGGPLSGGVVPLVMLGVGVYLLVQRPGSMASAGGSSPPSGLGSSSPFQDHDPLNDTVAPDSSSPPPPSDPATSWPAGGATVAGRTAPPRRRGRRLRRVLLGLAIVGFLAVGAAVAVGVALVNITDGAVDATFAPATIDEVPRDLVFSTGSVTLDLSGIDASAFADDPVRVDIELDAGELVVIVPDGVATSADLSANVGSVELFGQVADGFNPALSATDVDPGLELTANLAVGSLEVRRG